MTKQNLLVVDADPRSLRVLEVSLRNAGYNVAGCPSVGKAFEILHTNRPDLILSDTAFNDMDGFAFVEQLRQSPQWSAIPFMFLSSDETIESKIRGLELGVQDYLTKPIYIREVVARVGIELARQAREGLAQRTSDARTRFSGSLSEMSVVDLLQTIDVSRKSGVLNLRSEDGEQGMISFDSGAVIHAAVENLGGEDGVYRLLLWRYGTFDLEFRHVSLVERTVHRTTQALLMEGMRRLDEWSRLSELLPPFHVVLEVDGAVLKERLHDTPDDQNVVVRLIDGHRTIGEVINAHGGDHVDALRKIVDLYFEGIAREVGEVKDSIPILAQVQMPVSSMPPKVPVDTIPGPGPKPSLTPVSIPSMGRLPVTDLAPSSTPAATPESVPPASSVPDSRLPERPASDLVPTPESFPSPLSIPPTASRSLPRRELQGDENEVVPASQPPTVAAPPSDSESGALAGWAPAPPPTPRPRRNTPRGFQAVQGGGTILNWAGRVPQMRDITDSPTVGANKTGSWDQTLEELRDDPEVTEAIAIIDSEPPPGPFVRSRPPSSPEIATHPKLEPEAGAHDRETVEYHEPPEVDPPPLTYAQVFEDRSPKPSKPPTIPAATRKPPASASRDVEGDPARYVWLAVFVFAVVAMAYVLSSPRGGEEIRRAEEIVGEAAIAEANAVAEAEPAGVAVPEAGPATETETAAGTEAAAGTETESGAATEATGAAKTEPVAGTESAPEADGAPVPGIYAETGVEDTYEAQLALARRLKRGSRATAAYRRAIELNPEGSEALAELARLQLGREHTREAGELAERATALDPSNALAWVVLGASRQVRGDQQGARQAYRNCVKLGKGRFVSECRIMLP